MPALHCLEHVIDLHIIGKAYGGRTHGFPYSYCDLARLLYSYTSQAVTLKSFLDELIHAASGTQETGNTNWITELKFLDHEVHGEVRLFLEYSL